MLNKKDRYEDFEMKESLHPKNEHLDEAPLYSQEQISTFHDDIQLQEKEHADKIHTLMQHMDEKFEPNDPHIDKVHVEELANKLQITGVRTVEELSKHPIFQKKVD